MTQQERKEIPKVIFVSRGKYTEMPLSESVLGGVQVQAAGYLQPNVAPSFDVLIFTNIAPAHLVELSGSRSVLRKPVLSIQKQVLFYSLRSESSLILSIQHLFVYFKISSPDWRL